MAWCPLSAVDLDVPTSPPAREGSPPISPCELIVEREVIGGPSSRVLFFLRAIKRYLRRTSSSSPSSSSKKSIFLTDTLTLGGGSAVDAESTGLGSIMLSVVIGGPTSRFLFFFSAMAPLRLPVAGISGLAFEFLTPGFHMTSLFPAARLRSVSHVLHGYDLLRFIALLARHRRNARRRTRGHCSGSNSDPFAHRGCLGA